MQQSMASLLEAVEDFKQSGRCSGDISILNNLNNLDKLLASKHARQQIALNKDAAGGKVNQYQQQKAASSARWARADEVSRPKEDASRCPATCNQTWIVAMHASTDVASVRQMAPSPMAKVTAEEMQSIVKALMKGDADLAGGGYTGQGHFFKCPNGHPYVIGDCGGATELSRCPECGACIGGIQHQLTSGNTQDMTMHSLAGQAAPQNNWM